MDDGHAALVGEFPQILSAAADTDLDRALGVEHARQHRLPERPAVMELRALEGRARIAMRIDMHHADRLAGAQRLQDRQADRMIAADAQRRDAGRDHPGEERLDVLVAVLEAEAAAEGNVADIGDCQLGERRQAMDVMVRPDSLDRPHSARAEPRTGPIGDAEVHRHAHQCHVEAAEVRLRGIRAQGRVEKGRYALVGLRTAVGAGKHLLHDRLGTRGGATRPARRSHSERAGYRASCCPCLGSGCASVGCESRPKIARSFPGCSLLHTFTHCYP